MALGDAWQKLYGGHASGDKDDRKNFSIAHRDLHTPEDLQRALECGNWGPAHSSELFLKVNPNFSGT
jgi:hypothetical protein